MSSESSSEQKYQEYRTPYESPLNIGEDFHDVHQKLRKFFLERGFIEVHTQNRLSILAACEDPFNVSTFDYVGETWPLPQTGQMWLEYELLKNPKAPGYFCMTTSYRHEENPVPGRHSLIFPLFEFEMKGDMEELISLEMDLLEYLGYSREKFGRAKYQQLAEHFKVKELEHEEEMKIYTELDDGYSAFFLTNFPEFTSPFWNMRRDSEGEGAKKVDVILSGQETIGSAERETDIEVMREMFMNIMDGAYKDKIVELFGEERTYQELEDFLSLNFIERCGGGIGMTRLIRSMKLEGLI